jgi:PhzF family phenazine biosynthesis protein
MKLGSDHLFPVYQVDAFADKPFGGNPAAVVFLMGPRTDNWMQAFAAEMNLSETAFFMRKGDAYQLRWFTPTTEVDLCGHATLATAHVIWETELLMPDEEIRFSTKSGLIRAKKEGDWIALDFPAESPAPTKSSTALAKALGAPIVWAGQNRMDWFLELENEAAVRNLAPNMEAVKALGNRGVIVTAAADDPESPYHFVSRFFGPAVGVDEDPVTGSAHCALAPYWCEKLDRTALVGYQASPRGGTVKVRLRGNRVELKGKAITIFQGVISKQAVGNE